MTEPVVHATPNASEYLRHAGDFLSTRPVEHSVLLTTAHRIADDPPGDAVWLWAEQDGRVVAAVQHVPPWQAYVSLLPDYAVAGLVGVLHELRPQLGGVGGMRPAAEAFARQWAGVAGRRVETALRQGVYVADTVHHPGGVDGRLHRAEESDIEQVQRWSEAFQAEIGTQHVPRVDERPRVLSGLCCLWEDGGGPVSMAAATRAYGGVVRVSLVYTPPVHRRRGYAAACVAAVTELQLRQSNRCMLYTDLANSTSNGVYQRVGYRQVGEAVDLRFE